MGYRRGAVNDGSMTVVDITFRADWTSWHDRHEARRSDPHGFLAITGLHWLSPTPQRFPDAPGEWTTGPEGVVLTLADNEQVDVDGRTVHGRHALGVIPERDGVDVRWRDAVIEVAKR